MEVGDSDSQRLTFTFSNSGEVQTYRCNPELKAEPSLSQDQSPSAYSSLQIVHRPDLGFELKIDSRSAPPKWLQHLKSELEIPDNAILRQLIAPGSIFGVRWQNYILRFVGMIIEQPAQSECSWPFWRISDSNGNEVELVQVWFQRVGCMSSPIYCDVRWQPDRGETINFPGIENARRMRDVTLAWRGRVLLQKINPKGRPESSATLTENQFIERAPQVCAKLLDTVGEMPTDVQIAEELHISRATLYRYMARYNFTLNEIRDTAVKLLIEPAPF